MVFQVGGVAKWSKATVCKTVIRRFESARRLFLFHCYSAAYSASKAGVQNNLFELPNESELNFLWYVWRKIDVFCATLPLVVSEVERHQRRIKIYSSIGGLKYWKNSESPGRTIVVPLRSDFW